MSAVRICLFALLGLAAGLALGWIGSGWSPRPEGDPPRSRLAQVVAMAILGAAAFALSAARFHPLGVAALLGPFILLVAEVALIDARTKLIPNRLVYPALGAALAAVLAGTLAGSHLSIGHGLIGLAVYGGGLLLIALAAPSSMGMGDVKLAALIGLVLGSVTLTAVWRAALAGIFAGGIGALVALTVFRYGRRQAIPYGPFLAIGAIAAAITIPRTG